MSQLVGITIIEKARSLGLRIPPNGRSKAVEDAALRMVYEAETGRDPNQRFDSGIAKAQWEYGLRGTDYYAKERRAGLLELIGREQ